MPKLEPPDWRGRTVACLASGPSLTPADCERVRAAGLTTVACNTTYQLAPWADAVFGFDSAWWKHYAPDVLARCAGTRYSMSAVLARYGVVSLKGVPWFADFLNTGACAISLAVAAGARRVLLLGYDCAPGPQGRKHWHPDHPAGMTNALSIAHWPKRFASLASYATERNVTVLNCSRQTVLTCFARVDLETALADPAVGNERVTTAA